MAGSPQFFIIKHSQENCEILSAEQLENQKDPSVLQQWGPFNSKEEAIARRVGLIRSGKCKPQ